MILEIQIKYIKSNIYESERRHRDPARCELLTILREDRGPGAFPEGMHEHGSGYLVGDQLVSESQVAGWKHFLGIPTTHLWAFGPLG